MARRLQRAEGWALFLDFDGTLAPFTLDPRKARLAPEVKQTLRRLAGKARIRIYVISGRRLADLRRKISIPRVHLLGLHGWEKAGGPLPSAERPRLLRAKRWLAERLPAAPGIALEDKGFGLAVHYRGATPQAARSARRTVIAALDRFNPGVYLLRGRRIWELLPGAVEGKGETARKLLARLPGGWLPICLGDDISDESAFASLRQGLTIHVGGRRNTRARFRLRSPAEVREFLERLEAIPT